MNVVEKLNLLTFEQKREEQQWLCIPNLDVVWMPNSFYVCYSISIPTVQVLNADDRFEIHKSDSDSSPTFWSRWSGKYKRYIMKKRETRKRHENAYNGLRLREEECAKWNAPNWTWTWVRLCFRDHSQKTNVYTRQFVPEIISSQGVLFQGRQWSAIDGQLVLERIWAFFSLGREESSRRKKFLH